MAAESSLHLVFATRPSRRGSCQGVKATEAAGEDGLGGFGFGNVAEADGYLDAIRRLCGEHDVAAFDLRQFIQQPAWRVAEAGAVHPAGERLP